MSVARILDGGIAAVGGGVDADGTRRHLRDGDDIGKLCRRQPVVVLHRLVLNQRQHAVSPSESEEADLKERDKQIEKNHIVGTNFTN